MRPVLRRVGPCVVLGVGPAVDGARAWAPDSASGLRLAKLADVEPRTLGRVFALDNLVPLADPSREALRDAGSLYRFMPSWWYVLAGTEVVRALGRRARPARDRTGGSLPWGMASPGPLAWYESAEGITMAVLPHPSGRNRWYNSVRCREAAEAFLVSARWTGRGAAHAIWEGHKAE